MKIFRDGNNNPTAYDYDADGRLVATRYPGANATTGADIERTTLFDDSGLPLQSVDGRGVITNVGYTPDGLPQSVSYPASAGENVSLSYDAFGQVASRTDASGSESYIYNYVGRLYRQTTTYRRADGSALAPFTQTTHYHRSGALYRLETSLGNLYYAYDAAGRMTGLQDPDGATTSWNYGVNDWLLGQTLPVGTTSAMTRNVLGQVTSLRHANAGSATLSAWGHATDPAQRQLYNATGQLTRSVSLSTPSFKWGGTTNYAYDTRSQLTQETSTRGAAWNGNSSDSFAYTGTGNPGSWKGITRGFNANNQETARTQPVAYLYDGAGNTTRLANYNLASASVPAPTQLLSYSAQGQMSELRDSANALVSKYVYRGDGKRAWKEGSTGTRTYFYYAGEKMIALSSTTGTSTLLLWGADGLVGYRSSGNGAISKRYHLCDPQGNLAQTLDESGAVVGQSAFGAWGEPLREANGTQTLGAFGYGAKFGYWRDGESGFYLCTLRYYDPSAGRWLTRDPIGYSGGSNLYGYSSNDPVNNVDPSGLRPIGSHDLAVLHLLHSYAVANDGKGIAQTGLLSGTNKAIGVIKAAIAGVPGNSSADDPPGLKALYWAIQKLGDPNYGNNGSYQSAGATGPGNVGPGNPKCNIFALDAYYVGAKVHVPSNGSSLHWHYPRAGSLGDATVSMNWLKVTKSPLVGDVVAWGEANQQGHAGINAGGGITLYATNTSGGSVKVGTIAGVTASEGGYQPTYRTWKP